MELQRPTPATVSLSLGSLTRERLWMHRRRLPLALGAVLGASMTGYGLAGLFQVGPDTAALAAEESVVVIDSDSTLAPGLTEAQEPGPDRRAMVVRHDADRPLQLSVGDTVELVAVVSGPLETEAVPLGRGSVTRVDEEAVVIVTDEAVAGPALAAESDGRLRLLGLGSGEG